jgi:alpha-L-glutamate ligase-like protein
MMFRLLHDMLDAGVLGINKRNADYILPYNARRFYPQVDDKEKTKKLAIAAAIAVPELYHVVAIEQQIAELPRKLEAYSEFVIKPARGSGGDGILIINGRQEGMYRKSSGNLISAADLQYHVSNILSGIYSLGGQNDKCLIEYMVRFDDEFASIAYLGVPDIRIICFFGVPVMAMARLPTRLSDGKANLHRGALGAGIDMATGRTLSAVLNNEVVNEHPDTGNAVSGIEVPHWDAMLDIASRCYELTGLGYQGIDLVLDRDRGPMMLEINARPGLNIQIANRRGLVSRLEKVKANIDGLQSTEERIRFARHHFAHQQASTRHSVQS